MIVFTSSGLGADLGEMGMKGAVDFAGAVEVSGDGDVGSGAIGATVVGTSALLIALKREVDVDVVGDVVVVAKTG